MWLLPQNFDLDIYKKIFPNPFAASKNGEKKKYIDFIVCITARSGSTALCDSIEKTNILGQPREYINPRGSLNELVDKIGVKSLNEYFSRLREDFSTSNNVFSIKTNFWDFYHLIHYGLISKNFQNPKYIFLTRRNLVYQAISLEMAVQRQYWHKFDRDNQAIQELKKVQFNVDSIKNRIRTLSMEETNWKTFFRIHNIGFLPLFYEDIIKDFESAVKKIAAFIGVDLPQGIDFKPRFKKIGDELNTEWANKFRAEIGL